MRTEKILVLGFAALLVTGLALAGGFGGWGIGGAGCADRMGELGLSENATREEVREAVWQKKLSDLNLTEDSTVGELREAMEARMQQTRERMQERHQEMLGKLGLDEESTPEEVREAMKQYREDNPDDCPCKMKRGFHRGRMFGK